MPSKKVSKKRSTSRLEVVSWDDAIGYAREQIDQASRRILALEGTIQVFLDRKRAGEPFPGSQTDS